MILAEVGKRKKLTGGFGMHLHSMTCLANERTLFIVGIEPTGVKS